MILPPGGNHMQYRKILCATSIMYKYLKVKYLYLRIEKYVLYKLV